VLLLDTNVVSELVRPRPEPKIVAFVASQAAPLLSSLTIFEIVYGAERARDASRRIKLLSWAVAIQAEFAGRIVDVDPAVAERAGRLRAYADANGSPTQPTDALIAACALTRGATVATRNVRDFAAFGVAVINPWTP